MPAYPWLFTNKVDDTSIASHMRGLRRVGVPYTDAEIAAAPDAVRGRAEIDALVAYLQVLGTAVK
jgi:cytochrome c oxidase cbb3-type subunit 2